MVPGVKLRLPWWQLHGFTFHHPITNMAAAHEHDVLKPFKEHVKLVFSGPLCKAERNKQVGWVYA